MAEQKRNESGLLVGWPLVARLLEVFPNFPNNRDLLQQLRELAEQQDPATYKKEKK